MLPGLSLLACCALVAQPQAQIDAPGREKAARSVVRIQAETGSGQYQSGSGIVLGQGCVATNAHVVKNAYRIRVLKDSRSWDAEALCLLPDRDLVLLKLPGLPLPAAEPAPRDQVQVGAPVLSLGYPGGLELAWESGAITALWAFRGDRLIQSGTHNRPGSSGGGLFTMDGRLLGITTFGLSNRGAMDFAIPADWVLDLLQERRNDAPLRCPLVVVDRLLADFTALMLEDPANLSNWEQLTRAWVRDSPMDPEAWFALGTALDWRLREAPEDVDLRQRAMGAYRKTVDLAPGHAKAWNNLGAVLDSQNRFPEAQEAFRRALAADPGYALAWTNLGASLMNVASHREAAEAFTRGLALAGDQAGNWARLGFCEQNLGRPAAAADHYRLALRYEPFRAEWWGELYRSCLQARRPDGASEALERLRALAPDLALELTKRREPRP